MTTRKINMIQRAAVVGRFPETFNALLAAVSSLPGIESMTAKQIAVMIDFGYQQKEYGRNEMFDEMR